MSRRVLFLLPHLGHGGAERVVTLLLEHLQRERWQPELGLIERSGELLEAVPNDVVVHDLAAVRLRYALGAIARLAHAREPALLFSSMSYVNLGLLALRRRLPRRMRIVLREPTLLSSEVGRKRLAPLWRAGYRRLYPRADAIVCPARSTRSDLIEAFGIPPECLTCIPNPVDVERVRELASEPSPYPSGGPHVVGVGRLSPEKGYDRALDAFVVLAREEPDAHLWLVGEGPERASLEAQAARLGVAERVHLVGFVANPYPWLHHAHAFVQTSHYEGMPNALLEALACGTPAVALEAPGGTREVIEAAPGARMVAAGNPSALARALAEAAGASKRSTGLPPGFSLPEVVGRFDALFTAVCEAASAADC